MPESTPTSPAEIIALISRQGFDEADLYCLESLVRMELPRAPMDTAFLVVRRAQENRTGGAIALVVGAICVVAPIAHRLSGGAGNLLHWVLPVLGVFFLAFGLSLLFLYDPAKRGKELLAHGVFVVGQVTGVMGKSQLEREQYLSASFRLPSGQLYGVHVQGRELLGAIEEGDPVVVLCSPTAPGTAGVVTPTKLLTLGKAYPAV